MVDAPQVSVAEVVFVVEDDQDMRDSLTWLLTSQGLAVQAFAGPQEFLEQFDATRSGCLVSDVRMPGFTGIELYERLIRAGCTLPVIFLTAHADYPAAVRAFRAGAVDFLEKPFEHGGFLDLVRGALQRDRELRSRAARWSDLSLKMSALPDREREVLSLLMQGLPNKSIAIRLEITERAVEMRRANLMKRLDVGSMAELVRLATEFEVFSKISPGRPSAG